jgi:hypothetical protein
VASHTLNPMLYSKLPYDADKDIVGISRVAVLSNLLGVPQSLPVSSVAELIALCKKEPGKYSFASSGPGTSLHLSGELFKTMAGVDIIHVPYKGAGPAYNDLVAGTVQMMFANMPSMLPQVRGGKLKGLGRHLGRALEGRARHPGHRRDAAGLRRHLVVRRRRAGRHARADPGQLEAAIAEAMKQPDIQKALGRRSRARHAAARPRRLRRRSWPRTASSGRRWSRRRV